jgi:antitoxin (DNA-binding transcriptional repressor) of toxin-antitoxin stability system
MSEMPVSDAREHLGEVVGRARYGGEETILTHYGSPRPWSSASRNTSGSRTPATAPVTTSYPPRSPPRSAKAASTPNAASPAPAGPPASTADGHGRVRPAAPAGLRRAGENGSGQLLDATDDTIDAPENDPGDATVRRRSLGDGLRGIPVRDRNQDWLIIWERDRPQTT